MSDIALGHCMSPDLFRFFQPSSASSTNLTNSISNSLIAITPKLSDAAILTGIGYSNPNFGSFIEAWGLRIATQQAPGKWPGRDNNSVMGVDAASNVATFFHGDS